MTVDEVATELERGRDTYLDHVIAILGEEIPVVEPAQSARTIEQGLLKTLDPGEPQAVAVAEAVDKTVVTDDGGRVPEAVNDKAGFRSLARDLDIYLGK